MAESLLPRVIRARAEERAHRLKDRLETIEGIRAELDRDSVRIGSAKEGRGVVLFVDIVASTKLAIGYRDQPEKMLATLNLVIPTMMDVVRYQGGTFEKNTGDGLLAYFGLESGVDDPTAASVACAAAMWMMWSTSQVTNPLLQRRRLREVRITIGADLGNFLVGRIGLQRLQSPLVAVGEVANRAAKIQQSARPGEIRIGENLHGALSREARAHFQRVQQPPSPWPFRVPRPIHLVRAEKREARVRADAEFVRRLSLGITEGLFSSLMAQPAFAEYVPETRPYRIYESRRRW